MKELSIEEKAKAYESIFERLKEMYNNNKTNVGARLIYEKYFPELKESEDERIRKALLEMVHDTTGDSLWVDYNVHKEDAIAWLEKQGEHANFLSKIQIDDKVTRNKDGVLVNLSQLKRVAKRDEKQGEQKPAWSEEDKQHVNSLLKRLDGLCRNEFERTKFAISEDRDWLESLRPQNSSVTDEELAQAKKDAYNDALNKIEYHSGEPTFDDGWSAAIWYLKKRNTQAQNTWKPSDEQMKVLDEVIKNPHLSATEYNTLTEIEEQLKKL